VNQKPKIWLGKLLAATLCFSFLSYCQEEDSSLVEQLSTRLRHKFVLDFLLKHIKQNEVTVYDKQSNERYANEPEYVRKLEPSDTAVLEEFMFIDYYRLYKTRSLIGDKEYFLLAMYGSSLVNLFLFTGDTCNTVLLDIFEFNAPEARFSFEYLNSCHFLKIKRRKSGIGYYGKEEGILAIKNDRFQTLFSTKTIEIRYPEDDNDENVARTINKILYIDLNHDGFQDILEESSKDVIDRGNAQESGKSITAVDESYIKVRIKQSISRDTHEYLWNNTTYSFDKVK